MNRLLLILNHLFGRGVHVAARRPDRGGCHGENRKDARDPRKDASMHAKTPTRQSSAESRNEHIIYTPQSNLNPAEPTRDATDHGTRQFASHATDEAPDRYPTTEHTNGVASAGLIKEVHIILMTAKNAEFKFHDVGAVDSTQRTGCDV